MEAVPQISGRDWDCLPIVVRLKDDTISWSELNDRSLDRDGTSATRVKSNSNFIGQLREMLY